ncbi:MAG: di-heme oxidoredictase family protein [Pseudomonadota bacterium]
MRNTRPSPLIALLLLTPISLAHAQPGEHYPGGATSHLKALDQNAFSHPSSNMSLERQMDFKLGNGFFKRLWVSAPASTQAADGLGPLYNARSCERCHRNDGRGRPSQGSEHSVSMILRLSIPAQTAEQQRLLDAHRATTIPEPTYGAQLQELATPGQTAEGRVRIDYEEIPINLNDGSTVTLRKPTYHITELGYGPLHPQTLLSPRIAPPMIGLGLLEAIAEEDILALADPDDRNGDGISGKPNRVWSAERQQVMLGRFGWKAGSPNLAEQVQAAFANDIGISAPLHPGGSGDCTVQQKKCLDAPSGNSPQYENLEAPRLVTDLVAFYARNLAVPARRGHDDPKVLAGKKLFHESGCAACHTPRHITRTVEHMPEQSQQEIWPYTDLLLHDMGEELADHRPEGAADGREWRTPPLWGIGLNEVVNGNGFYLHDGRARTLLEAILWHGGEAQRARDAVVHMTSPDRANLLAFINSL